MRGEETEAELGPSLLSVSENWEVLRGQPKTGAGIPQEELC